jgi:hypothetical protein
VAGCHLSSVNSRKGTADARDRKTEVVGGKSGVLEYWCWRREKARQRQLPPPGRRLRRKFVR